MSDTALDITGSSVEPSVIDCTSDDWAAALMAPVLSVAYAGGLQPEEHRKLEHCLGPILKLLGLNYFDWKSLVDQKGLKDRTCLLALEEKLQLLLSSVPSGAQSRFREAIWDACAAVAESANGIDRVEQQELLRIARLLGLSNDLKRGQVLGHELARELPAELPLPPAPPANAASSEQRLALPEAVRWAKGWSGALAAEAYSLFERVFVLHKSMAERGAGRLAGVKSLDQVVFDAVNDYSDSGVVILSRPWETNPVYVVGDLHGDIDSLFRVLEISRFLEGSQTGGARLLFLGDYGDREAGTLAVWLTVAHLKACFPQRVMLLRGNHDVVIDALANTVPGAPLPLKDSPCSIPMPSYMETFGALCFALGGDSACVSEVMCQLPTVAVFPSGKMAVHGGVLPGWRSGDGWRLAEDRKVPLAVGGIDDLRKPLVQFVMRWVDMENKDRLDMAWSRYSCEDGRHYRLSSAKPDFADFARLTGIRHMIHGHSHPVSGFDPIEGDGISIIGLNCYRNAAAGAVACMGLYEHGGTECLKIPLFN